MTPARDLSVSPHGRKALGGGLWRFVAIHFSVLQSFNFLFFLFDIGIRLPQPPSK